MALPLKTLFAAMLGAGLCTLPFDLQAQQSAITVDTPL